MLFSKQTPGKNVQLVNRPSENATHIWKIAATLFEGDVWENISDDNRADNSRAEANQFKWSSLSGYFFSYRCDSNFLENFKDMVVFCSY